MRLGVVGKIAAFLVLPVVLVLGGLLYAAGARLSRAEIEQARAQLQETVTAYARQADARVSEIESLGRTTASFLSLGDQPGFAGFIELAEESGLINRLGAKMLHKACVQQVAWVEHGLAPVVMAVNVSSQQVSDPNVALTVIQIMTESAIDRRASSSS